MPARIVFAWFPRPICSILLPVNGPSILTNMAFRQSPVWVEATTTICHADESPDTLGCARQVWRLLRRRGEFDVVLTMGSRVSLAYGLLCALLHLPAKHIMTEVFLDASRPASLTWRLKTALFRLIARRAMGILTNSSGEVELIAPRFQIPTAKLRFVPMYSTLPEPAVATTNEGFVFSMGRTLRDLPTLFQAAADLTVPVVVVVDQRDSLPSPIPTNVQIHRNLSLAAGRELMRRSTVVAIPLLPAERSTGQVVLFEAMAMGKPVVATRAVGTSDYIRDNENGLLVNPGDPAGLAAAIHRLIQDPALAARLGSTAHSDTLARWQPDHHARHKLAAIAELWPAG